MSACQGHLALTMVLRCQVALPCRAENRADGMRHQLRVWPVQCLPYPTRPGGRSRQSRCGGSRTGYRLLPGDESRPLLAEAPDSLHVRVPLSVVDTVIKCCRRLTRTWHTDTCWANSAFSQ